MVGRLVLENGAVFEGILFGHPQNTSGEVVFNTGMVGYPQSLTDPSYRGQILVLTYPLIGNYGVPKKKMHEEIEQNFESQNITVQGLIVSDYSADYSHWDAQESLGAWLMREKIPALYGIDTRALTKTLRHSGVMLGKIEIADTPSSSEFFDPNIQDIVGEVSCKKKQVYLDGRKKRVVVIDCGVKNNILLELIKREVTVISVPYDYDFLAEKFDGVLISNGPGDPQMCTRTIENIRRVMEKNVPVFGICLGNQILALAAGAQTYKLKFGHRGQNQPCIVHGTKRCFITTQNHGFAVDTKTLPAGWEPFFVNANDGTNEGIRHTSKPFFSVQFHPESAPGPLDTGFLFDDFVKLL